MKIKDIFVPFFITMNNPRYQNRKTTPTTRSGGVDLSLKMMILLSIFAITNILYHHSQLTLQPIISHKATVIETFKTTTTTTTTKTSSLSSEMSGGEKTNNNNASNHDHNEKTNDQEGENYQHTLHGLNCARYGGPSDEISSEMIYWHDIPSDSNHVSPFQKKKKELYGNDQVMYLTFEPDGGGWNNIRMAMETVVVMAYAMGRTLVLPPEQRMYLLGKDRSKQKTHFSFSDFFHLDSVHAEHAGLDIITTEEFLEREAMTGHLRNKITGEVEFPPFNRTKWDGLDADDITVYKEWIRNVTLTPIWRPSECLAAFPSSTDTEDITDLKTFLDEAKTLTVDRWINDPISVDSSPAERMSYTLSGKKQLCIYDEVMQQAPVLHFMCYHKMKVRLLTHFYAFLFFEDWRQDLWAKRFVRDHLRYLDELQCAAARVVNELREIARKKDPIGNPKGLFNTFHIRRGDFQYKSQWMDAATLFENSKDELPMGSVIFIATDEGKRQFFAPFAEHHDLYFLNDFKHLYEGLNTNYYGMLDQLIASRGEVFFGTFQSTFTGYINRMRGYHSTKNKEEGYEVGTLKSYYFAKENKFEMRKYAPIRGAIFSREFPMAWRDIDKGIYDDEIN